MKLHLVMPDVWEGSDILPGGFGCYTLEANVLKKLHCKCPGCDSGRLVYPVSGDLLPAAGEPAYSVVPRTYPSFSQAARCRLCDRKWFLTDGEFTETP